jgi:hypothetical protein
MFPVLNKKCIEKTDEKIIKNERYYTNNTGGVAIKLRLFPQAWILLGILLFVVKTGIFSAN